MKKTSCIIRLTFLLAALAVGHAAPAEQISTLASGFRTPPESAQPWVYWFWINGNISKEGITKDLEAYDAVGVNGVIMIEVAGPKWPPLGKVEAYTPEWNEAVQWAIHECARLGMKFGMTIDFGYGCGGPHITPENSMQQLYWSESEVKGGKKIRMTVPRPEISKKLVHLRLPEGKELRDDVRKMIDEVDAYRDVAVLAMPLPATEKGRAYRIPQLDIKQGLANTARPSDKAKNSLPFSPDAVIPLDKVIDLTDQMDENGTISWNAPEGDWLILRIGHAPNYHITRPVPVNAMGLEADRLSPSGIEAHYKAFIKPVIDGAGDEAGRTFMTVLQDSWEAGHQNWTAAFPEEFNKLRGYDLRKWLPTVTGRVIESRDASNRFLDDVGRTVSDLLQQNFSRRFSDLLHADGLKFSHEPYGQTHVDYPAWASIADIPMSEFWARGTTLFPNINGYSGGRKTATSICNTYGKPVHAAEAFTADRGWRDHPWTLKSLGDKAFAEGINRLVFHCAVHQPYENAVPGLSHRKWGNHFTRFNTWWFHSQGWIDYLTRCQYLLQHGSRVADVLYWKGERIDPENENFRHIYLRGYPEGYDYDVATDEVFFGLSVNAEGHIVIPTGLSYRYLMLPKDNRMTPEALRKIQELTDAGVRVIAGPRPVKSVGLHKDTEQDAAVAKLSAELWRSGKLITGKKIPQVFAADGLAPDMNGNDLFYVHKRIDSMDVYFVANKMDQTVEQNVSFRITSGSPELWDPETGEIRPLPEFDVKDNGTVIPLTFDPMDSYFIVFREAPEKTNAGENFPTIGTLREIKGTWDVSFDPLWGGPEKPVVFKELIDWAQRPEQEIQWYSGTATYRRILNLKPEEIRNGRLLLDLGQVEVIARVRLNGTECGIAWKPPYRVDITDAAKSGENSLEIEVVNLWVNRMIGDEHFPLDSKWINAETLVEWPEWMLENKPRTSGRYTFTTIKHYDAAPKIYLPPKVVTKNSELFPSGMIGPVTLKKKENQK